MSSPPKVESSLETIIAQRQEQAAMKAEALQNRHSELSRKCVDGLNWVEMHEGRSDYERQRGRLARLLEMETKLYNILRQFDFPFNILYINIGKESDNFKMLTVVPDMQKAVEVFGLHPGEVLLPDEARFLLAERMELL